jgi:hypothetical protein
MFTKDQMQVESVGDAACNAGRVGPMTTSRRCACGVWLRHRSSTESAQLRLRSATPPHGQPTGFRSRLRCLTCLLTDLGPHESPGRGSGRAGSP